MQYRYLTILFLWVAGHMAAMPRLQQVATSALQAQEAITLNFSSFTKEPKYYKSGDWYVALENEDDWEVYLNWKAPKDNYCGTFTHKDFLHDYSYIFTPNNREQGGIHYDDITMTVSIVAINPALDQIVIDATIQGDDGNTYVIHATHDVIKAKQTIDVTIMDAQVHSEDGQFTLSGNNEQMNVQLVVWSNQIIGTYNAMSDFDLDQTRISYNGKTITPLQIQALVDVGYVQDNQLAYGAQISILATDTVIYTIKMAAPLPHPTDTAYIACQNMRIDATWAEAYNMITVNASNTDYQVSVMYYDNTVHAATYTEANAVVNITSNATNVQVASLLTTVTMEQTTANQTTQWLITGQARCSDNTIYILHLTWQVPPVQQTKTIRFATTAQASYYHQQNHDLLFMNDNDDYSLSLNIHGVPMGGAFSLDDMELYYTSLTRKQDKQAVELAQVDGHLYQSGDTTWMDAQIIGFDSIRYDVSMWYCVPVPTDTITLHVTDVPFTNHLDEGYFQLIGYTEDATTMISFTPATHNVEGVFVNDGRFGRFGDGQYDFFNDYTYIAEWNEDSQEYVIHTVEKGELSVQMAADGSIAATACVVCDNAKCYRITMISQFERKHLEYDAEWDAVSVVYTAEDPLQITDRTAEDNLIVLQINAQDDSDMLVLYIFADHADSDIVIPEGVYPINASCQRNTVLASTGANEDNTVSPSLYTTMQAGYFETLYFLVDGTVQVAKTDDKKLYLTVDAVNSYDLPVRIIYDGSTTGVENVPSATSVSQKQLIHGQLYIVRDGKMYNIMGAQVK